MINKTFLILLLASLTYTVYNAAAVSETFEISTTIDHEIVLGSFSAASADGNLNKTEDINLGTITINPAHDGETYWRYSDSGIVDIDHPGAVISADMAIVGRFTANIQNPEDCVNIIHGDTCNGLSVTEYIDNLFGGSASDLNGCGFAFKYVESENIFRVYPSHCYMDTPSKVTSGTHTGTLTISYTPS